MDIGKVGGVVAVLFISFCADAQVVDQKYENKVQAARVVSALKGPYFGESVSEYTGGVSFSQTDISIPGSNGLPVELRRRFSVEDKYGMNSISGFGDWDVDVPSISGIFDSAVGWSVAPPSSPNRYNRCSSGSVPYLSNLNFNVDEVWGGHQLHIPGVEDGQLLSASFSDSYPEPSDGRVYPWITQAQSRLRCLPTTKNGYPGEGFALLTKDGVTYYFDWGVEVAIRGIGKDSSRTIGRKRIYLLASRIEDRVGNWVEYGYSGSRLTAITSSDGRSINITYSGGLASTASAGAGIWTYQYDSGGNLSRVNLPDSSSWTFGFTGNLKTPPPPSLPPLDDYEPTCDEAEVPENPYEYRIAHPSGAVGKFSFQQRRFYRSRVPWMCNNTPAPGSYDWLTIQNYFDVYSLHTSVVTGPGLVSQTSTYDYGWSNPLGFCNRLPGGGCMELCLAERGCTTPEGRWVTTTRPDGSKIKRLLGVQYGLNEGWVLRVQTISVNGDVLSDTQVNYVTDAEISSMPFTGVVGNRLVRDPMVGRMRPKRAEVNHQDGQKFTYRVDSYDQYARPVSVTKSSAPAP